MKRIFTDEQEDYILQAYMIDWQNYSRLAKEYQVSRHTIKRACQRADARYLARAQQGGAA